MHLRPTDEQLAPLTAFERRAFELSDFVNSNPRAKHAAQTFLRTVGAGWVYYCSRNLVHILGSETLRNLRPAGGLLLTSNHRSFFDQYVISCWLFRLTPLLERLYFPVRAEFFYERPLGVAVNVLMSALAMYPPVFRAPEKREFNSYSVSRLVQLLQQPGTVIGVHPEGRRGKGPDPYDMLPAQPGVGKLILDARPTVLPIFINGLINDFVKQIRSNFDHSGQPIVIVVGEPLDLSEFYAKPNRLRTQKELGDHIRERILELGQRERAYRASLGGRPAGGTVIL